MGLRFGQSPFCFDAEIVAFWNSFDVGLRVALGFKMLVKTLCCERVIAHDVINSRHA